MGTTPDTRVVLTAADMNRAITRIAHEIVERTKGAHNVVLLGIPTRGVPLARRLADAIAAAEPGLDPTAMLGTLDITMYRDDLALSPVRAIGDTKLPPGGIDGKTVVLVDDVLFSGRSVRAALDALQDLGRPESVHLAAMVDRGHRRMPIRADFVGKNLPTALDERVTVRVAEVDGTDAVEIAHGPARRTEPGETGR